MLNSLQVKNFRSLEDFKVKKIGRVNLIVGKNNSGKSSVLEALRIYAGNANQALLVKIADGHDEKYLLNEDDQDVFDTVLPFEDLFTGRKFQEGTESIVIGETGDENDCLKITHGFLIREEVTSINEVTGEETVRVNRRVITDKSEIDRNEDNVTDALVVTKRNEQSIIDFSRSRMIHRRPFDEKNFIPCSVIPTQFISMDELAKEWDSIALTDGEEIVKEALRIVLPEFENLTFVIKSSRHSRNIERQAKVKISGVSRPVPLNSLGDGMLRVLQLVLKVFSAKDGILLIDEFENGLHYSVQEKVWSLLFKLSKKLNIQIFVTTHSWDCIESFSKVSMDNSDTEGVLFRVGKSIRKSNKGKVIATVFDEKQLCNITQSDVEVR